MRATSLPAGQRSVLVRVTDTGGNVVDRGPYPVFAVTPSDRGAPNGADATDSRHARRDLDQGPARRAAARSATATKAGVRGRLINSDGPADRRREGRCCSRATCASGAALIPRTTLTTDGDGRFSTTVTASASRLLQFAWLSHANDVRFGANGYLTLQARADAAADASRPAARASAARSRSAGS